MMKLISETNQKRIAILLFSILLICIVFSIQGCQKRDLAGKGTEGVDVLKEDVSHEFPDDKTNESQKEDTSIWDGILGIGQDTDDKNPTLGANTDPTVESNYKLDSFEPPGTDDNSDQDETSTDDTVKK